MQTADFNRDLSSFGYFQDPFERSAFGREGEEAKESASGDKN